MCALRAKMKTDRKMLKRLGEWRNIKNKFFF